MIRFDPFALARFQLQKDREATRRFPELLERKAGRMVASPSAFLRGAAPLFYEVLRQRPQFAEGPGGSGQIVGDLHLENFGAYRPADPAFEKKAAARKYEATFGLNDFDDSTIGPWRFDLLRVTTSLVLAGREMGSTGSEVLQMADALLDAWNDHAHAKSARRALPMPPPVAALVERVATRTRKELLDGRTVLTRHGRRFIRGPRYRDLPGSIARAVPAAFERYIAGLDAPERPPAERLSIIDTAFRIAGTGSLGSLRIAVLVSGKGGPDNGWIFDMKEQGAPSSHLLLPPPRRNGAKRVRLAIAACLEEPPMLVGVTKLDGRAMLVRRLTPQEDKLDLTRLDHPQLPALARYLGALIGAAHRRGVTISGKVWKQDELKRLVEKTVALAGLHEATYLAFCSLIR